MTPRDAHTPQPAQLLTNDECEQLAEAIEHFIMDDSPEMEELWSPYVKKLRAVSAGSDAPPRFDPTNHHNALTCPHCNPKQLKFAEADAPDYLVLLEEAQRRVKASYLYRKFIDGTPLENDIAVWMADFARDQLSPSPAVPPSHVAD